MAYTPINWQTGDTITAEKMNKMDNGWGVEQTQLFSGSVTTEARTFGNEAEISLQQITQNELAVTLNGTTYTCQRIYIESENANGYGGVTDEWIYDFTNYPFAIVSNADTTVFATQTAGTFTVTIAAPDVEVSTNFSGAVNKCVDTSSLPLLCVSGVTTEDEMTTAVTDKRIMYFFAAYRYFFISQVVSNSITFIPENQHVTASFVDNVFAVTES